MKKIILALLATLLGFGTLQGFTATDSSPDLSHFNRRFEIKRNKEGKIEYVRANYINLNFQFKSYLNQIKKDLIDLQKDILKQEANQDAYIEQLVQKMGYSADSELVSGKDSERETLKKALKNLPNVNLNHTFKTIDIKGVWTKLKDLLKQFYLGRRLDIISVPGDKKFFYNQKIANKIIEEAFKFARKQLGSIPVLNIALFLITDVTRKFEEQRELSQNMFLYYVANFEENLNFSAQEIDHLVSSIYESRIPLTGFQQSRQAQATWNSYGWNQFDSLKRMGNRRSRNWPVNGNMARTRNLGRLDYVFYTVQRDNKKLIVNAAMNDHMLTANPAISYDYSAPNKIRNLRTLVKLGQMALQFLPKVPGAIKNGINQFANSWYLRQQIQEGFLWAYFEMNANPAMAQAFKRQIANPFIR